MEDREAQEDTEGDQVVQEADIEDQVVRDMDQEDQEADMEENQCSHRRHHITDGEWDIDHTEEDLDAADV